MTGDENSFGPRLRGLRLAQGLSLSAFARRLHYSKGYLSRIENGLQSPGAEFARRCDAELDAGGLLAMLMAPRPKSPVLLDTKDFEGGVWLMTMAPDGEGSFVSMRRRDVLMAGVGSVVGMGTGALRAPQSSAARTEHAIPHLRLMFDEVRRLGQTASPSVVLPIVVAQAHALRALRPDAQGRARAELTMLTARTAEYAGWMAQEAGDDGTALWWIRNSVTVAEEAGNHDIATYALVRQALITLYQGDAYATIGLAQRAQADAGTPSRILGLAALREAQGHALAGDRDHCLHSLDRAAEHLRTAAADSVDGPVIGTFHVKDPVGVVTGWCLFDLGRPAEAAAVFDRELPNIPATALRARVRFGLRQILAHAAAGELDHACELARDMVSIAMTVDSATVVSDIRRLAALLRRWHSHPAVRALDPVLTAALHRGRV
ncbi:helix-turn-helix domain-containing protein [Actinokineospora sp.]|uniref:helix-turn-helix domain-containing protein n=1 Tax=Actinokineospora sp. TaxID=1872133 RepID=UPI004037AFB2